MVNKKLRALKAQKTKLLKKEVHTKKEFEEVQAKLDQVEFKILEEQAKSSYHTIYDIEDKLGISDNDEEANGLYDLSEDELEAMAKYV